MSISGTAIARGLTSRTFARAFRASDFGLRVSDSYCAILTSADFSGNGLKNYQRNNRPLTGDGVQEFAPAIGVGMLDSTICDIYLVDDAGNLIGRPFLTACVDAYSGLCCGYSLPWEGSVYSLRGLMLSVITDKMELSKRFGISINTED